MPNVSMCLYVLISYVLIVSAAGYLFWPIQSTRQDMHKLHLLTNNLSISVFQAVNSLLRQLALRPMVVIVTMITSL